MGSTVAGPVEGISSHICTNLVVTHTMANDAHVSPDTDKEVRQEVENVVGLRVTWHPAR